MNNTLLKDSPETTNRIKEQNERTRQELKERQEFISNHYRSEYEQEIHRMKATDTNPDQKIFIDWI